MTKYNPAVHHQDVNFEVPGCGLVNSDIDETSLYRFVLKN